MKKIITLALLTLSLYVVQAQNSKGNGVLYTSNNTINKFHTIDELQGLNKGELLKLYIERTREILIIVPYLSLTNKPGTTLTDVGIKADSDNLKVVEKNKEIAGRAFAYTENTIKELIPYSDTENIIWSILYFEEMIKRIRLGISGNN